MVRYRCTCQNSTFVVFTGYVICTVCGEATPFGDPPKHQKRSTLPAPPAVACRENLLPETEAKDFKTTWVEAIINGK